MCLFVPAFIYDRMATEHTVHVVCVGEGNIIHCTRSTQYSEQSQYEYSGTLIIGLLVL
jgi:hypothetical protein